jgi:WD40 repeat protein
LTDSATRRDGAQLWDPLTGALVHSLTDHAGAVTSVAFSPDGHLLATGSEDITVMLWNNATGERVNTLTGRVSAVTSVAFSPDGRILATGSDDHSVQLRELT